MKQIVDYAVVCENNHYTLGESVRKELRNGWVPFGSPTAIAPTAFSGAKFIQAIVLYEKESLGQIQLNEG